MEDRTVILTMIFDEAWARPGSVLDLFLESFRLGQGTKRLLNHLMIITLGTRAFRHCNAMHPHCFPPKPYGLKKGPLVLDHLMVQRKANDLLLQVLKLGYSFVFTEADVMWLSPFADIHPSYEITIPCDLSSDASQNRSNKQGRGLFCVRANARTTELLRYWKVWGTLYPNSSVESLCEVLKDQKEVTETFDVRIKYLDASYFGGFCRGGSKNISKAYTLQANCCHNVEEKVYDLRLVLEDWKIFKARSIKNNSGIVRSRTIQELCPL
ncbi:hypothetical protein TIFTF001_026647 [Ficus carica]|uniref:Nucleotide-diphospho-sugar transferase domain-containing protein n=1 Tax=Ficus carica TaxID=3494 RepID=A0AA88IYZ8_FICCA|nr:hypothetical protein TIFTF001_026647 [Ficus carica]